MKEMSTLPNRGPPKRESFELDKGIMLLCAHPNGISPSPTSPTRPTYVPILIWCFLRFPPVIRWWIFVLDVTCKVEAHQIPLDRAHSWNNGDEFPRYTLLLSILCVPPFSFRYMYPLPPQMFTPHNTDISFLSPVTRNIPRIIVSVF